MEKPKLTIVTRSEPPNTPTEKVRKSLRKTKVKAIPQCPSCGGRTFQTVQTDTLIQKACVFCLAKEHRIVVMV